MGGASPFCQVEPDSAISENCLIPEDSKTLKLKTSYRAGTENVSDAEVWRAVWK